MIMVLLKVVVDGATQRSGFKSASFFPQKALISFVKITPFLWKNLKRNPLLPPTVINNYNTCQEVNCEDDCKNVFVTDVKYLVLLVTCVYLVTTK